MDASALLSKLRAGGRDALARRLGVDARALAALRISLGVLLLADLALRSRHLVAFYTDAGVLPTAALREQAPGLARLSLHALSGAAWVQVALFLVAAAFALALLVGYRTTPVAVASWVLLVSLHARNPVVLNAGDSILRRLLFWGLFLPLGRRWSIDALRRGDVHGSASDRRDADSGPRVAGAASAALLLQVVLIYAVNAAFKLRVGSSWESGEAIRYVFSLDRLTVLLGNHLAQYPTLLGFADRVWLGLLVTSVLLVVLTGRARAAFASLFVGMHLGMALTMRLGVFPLVSAAALLAFLPPSVWDSVERRASPRVRRVVDATGLGGGFDRSRSNRPRDSSAGAFALPAAVGRWKRRLGTGIVVALLALVLVWNASTLGVVAAPAGSAAVADPGEHRWDMFAEPAKADGWYVVPGRLESGEKVDAFRDAPVRWDHPPDAALTYPSVRWYSYLMDFQRARNTELAADFTANFGAYLCGRWDARHDSDLESLTVYYVEQPTRFDGPEPTHRVELGRYDCGSGA